MSKSTRGIKVLQKRSDHQSAPATLAAISHDDIARRAYDIFDKNGRQQGRCLQNWQQAEQELQQGHPTSRGARYT